MRLSDTSLSQYGQRLDPAIASKIGEEKRNG
nr:MAG TPA: hypothetical protein [Caudoviricetes sp.]